MSWNFNNPETTITHNIWYNEPIVTSRNGVIQLTVLGKTVYPESEYIRQEHLFSAHRRYDGSRPVQGTVRRVPVLLSREECRNALCVALVFALVLWAALRLSRGVGSDAVRAGEHPLRISEYMANNTAYPNADGVFCDWLEIENTSDHAFNVSGYRLTDNFTRAKYAFPVGTVIPAGGQLTVWCVSGRTGGLYAPFSLKKQGGETILLMNSANTVLDRVDTLRSKRNLSFIRLFDGSLTVSDSPSPGWPNDAEGRAAYMASLSDADSPLRLSEIMTGARLYGAPGGAACDWIEVENTGTEPLDISGARLSDKEGEGRYVFPEGTVLAPGGFAVVWCSGDAALGADHAPFRLSRAGETVILTDAKGAVLDRISVPLLDHDMSYARLDGGWAVSDRATPGFANDENGYARWIEAAGWGGADIRITEIASANVSGQRDENGNYSDWIELYNAGSAAVSLEGWYLSDKAEKPSRWKFPAGTVLGPGETLVVWASGGSGNDGTLHAGFSLSVGETVTLTMPIGAAADEAEVIFTQEDHSQIRTGGDWTECDVPTPGRQGG